jgi:hypothetical protein
MRSFDSEDRPRKRYPRTLAHLGLRGVDPITMVLRRIAPILLLPVAVASSYSFLLPSRFTDRVIGSAQPTPQTLRAGSVSSVPFKMQRKVPHVILAQRGGAGSVDEVDPTALMVGNGAEGSGSTVSAPDEVVLTSDQLDRVKIRLEGLGTYAMISALLIGGMLGLFFNTPKTIIEGRILENAVIALFYASSTVSLLSSLYVTLVFSLVGLYSKTALGLSKDAQYLKFIDATRRQRNYAYDAFLLSIASFQSSFVMTLFLLLPGPARWVAAAATTVLLAFSFRSVQSVLNAAASLIFAED